MALEPMRTASSNDTSGVAGVSVTRSSIGVRPNGRIGGRIFASRAPSFLDAAEASFAAGIFHQCRDKVAALEIGPQRGDKNELGICRLPQQEVANAALAARADDDVGVGNAARPQM